MGRRERRKVKIVNRRGVTSKEPVPILSRAELEEARRGRVITT